MNISAEQIIHRGVQNLQQILAADALSLTLPAATSVLSILSLVSSSLDSGSGRMIRRVTNRIGWLQAEGRC